MRTFLFLITFLFSSEQLVNAQYDSLIHLLEKQSDQIDKANTYKELGNLFVYKNGDSARFFYRKGFELYPEDSLMPKANLLRKIAMSFIIENKLDSALRYNQEVLHFYRVLRDSLSLAYVHNNIGLLNINIDNYDEGTEHLIKALEFKEAISANYAPTKIDLGGTNLNIGIAMHNLERFEKAIEYYEIALKNYVLQDDSNNYWVTKMQMANAYVSLFDYEKSEVLFREILSSEIAFDQRLRPRLLNNFGSLLTELGDRYQEANEILSEAYKLNIEDGNFRSAVKNKNNMAENCFRNNQATKAMAHAQAAYDLSDQNNFKRSKAIAAQHLGNAYEMVGNFKLSSFYYKEYGILYDEYFTVEKSQIVSELEARYNNTKKQQTIDRLNAEKKIDELELKNKTQTVRWTSIGLGLIVFILVIIVIFLRKVNRQRILLNEQNNKLTELNNGLQKMFTIISHDMRNYTYGFKNAGNLLAFYHKNNDQEQLAQLSDKLQRNSQNLTTLLDNLLSWGLNQSGLYQINKQKINAKDIIDQQIKLMEEIAQTKNIQILNKLPEYMIVNFDLDNFRFIIRNLLSNALKYTENGEICFYKSESNGIVIEDTGIGMDNEKLNTIFKIYKGNSKKGTAGEKGSGLGLKLVKDFVILNGGDIHVKSVQEKGTYFTIKFN